MTKNSKKSQRSICLYFQVHQPMRLKRYRFFQIGADHYYYDDFLNRSIIKRVAEKCYLPTNKLILDLIKEYNGDFRVAFSLTGTVIDQLEVHAPEVIESFRELADTGCVEFLAETYSHSLAALKDEKEFQNQVHLHADKMMKLFNQKPTCFRNTELVYSDHIGEMVYKMGYETMLMEGAKHILGWKSPNYIYKNPDEADLKLIMRNYKLSDDIAFRFSNRDWNEWPLTTEKFSDWLNNIDIAEPTVNIFMDYETFGEHQWEETGIFEFLKNLPGKVLERTDLCFRTPSEVADINTAASYMHAPNPVSWADEERDLTAWLGNELQIDAFENLYAIAPRVYECKDEDILNDWKYLQNSDHFYYMCTKWYSDGDVHNYFTHFDSPYDAYINYMNVLADFEIRVKEICKCTGENISEKHNVELPNNLNAEDLKSSLKVEKKTKNQEISNLNLDDISKTKLKSILKDFEPIELYSLISSCDHNIGQTIRANIGKRVLTKVEVYVIEKQYVNINDKEKNLQKFVDAIENA
ncbi:MAG: glycoside hydrolase family 57 protein [Bacteroidales bacterium]|nr:glycoside hydrolase family 57 protein [Bacteroidales bacterium]